jgi:hypothetical protein
MNIEPYIAQLLYRYQCVTVPGFGAFLTETQSAQLLETTQSFSPPRKMISFNAYLKNNDGLLANHIAQSENISYNYAVSAIEFEVIKWKNTLEDNNILSIKNLGELRLNTDKNLVFTPNDQTNFLASSFGLSSFISPLIKREIFEKVVQVRQESIPIAIVPEIRRSSQYLKYAAIFVLGLAATGTIGYPLLKNQIASQTILVETAVQKQVQNKIQEATFFIENPINSVTLSVKDGKMPYHIMAGAFRREVNAQKTFENLTRLGYKAKRLVPNKNGLFPVIYGSYATFAEADKAMFEIQKTTNPDAWILIESL